MWVVSRQNWGCYSYDVMLTGRSCGCGNQRIGGTAGSLRLRLRHWPGELLYCVVVVVVCVCVRVCVAGSVVSVIGLSVLVGQSVWWVSVSVGEWVPGSWSVCQWVSVYVSVGLCASVVYVSVGVSVGLCVGRCQCCLCVSRCQCW